MECTTTKEGKLFIVDVAGRLDANTAGKFESNCSDWLAQGETDMIVDMSGVDYISSAGLRSILISAKKLRVHDGDIVFCGLQGMVEEVFKMSGFEKMFKVFATREQAVEG
ncbi:MAG: STAS domain-containing protein [Thermodesulfobacteriota bacterium]